MAAGAEGASTVALHKLHRADAAKSASRTLTETLTGEHEHTIVGYSLVKGLGDGEPVASERFSVGGHEWVLLFYPDGKRSSAPEGGVGPIPQPHAALPAPVAHAPMAVQHGQGGAGNGHLVPGQAPNQGNRAAAPGQMQAPQQQAAHGQQLAQQQPGHQQPQQPQQVVGYPQQVQQMQMQQQQQQQPQGRREANTEYSALFVALIGESEHPQGVVNTSEGRVVRAFHRFTLVDQTGQGRDLTKGRRRDQQPLQGAVKISCARQDPNARNCHGYRKFVKRSVLENAANGYLMADTIVIRYTIELVVTSGGALSGSKGAAPGQPRLPSIEVPPSTLNTDMASLLESGQGADVSFRVEGQELQAHKVVLTSRSPFFRALLNGPMKEGQEGVVHVQDVRSPVFKALLYFLYADVLPEDLREGGLDCAMAQHLLVAADRYEMPRLRRICERRLCETVDVDTVATTLTLAEQNHAEELKRVGMEFACKNLSAVLTSEGYQHMIGSCPQLQGELLRTIAAFSDRVGGLQRLERHHASARQHAGPGGGGAGAGESSRHAHVREAHPDEEGRRVRPRLRE